MSLEHRFANSYLCRYSSEATQIDYLAVQETEESAARALFLCTPKVLNFRRGETLWARLG